MVAIRINNLYFLSASPSPPPPPLSLSLSSIQTGPPQEEARQPRYSAPQSPILLRRSFDLPVTWGGVCREAGLFFSRVHGSKISLF